MHRIILFVLFGVITLCGCSKTEHADSRAAVSTGPVISAEGAFGYRFGSECDERTTKRWKLAARGDMSIEATGHRLPISVDYFSLGYSPRSRKLCHIFASKSYGADSADKEIFADLDALLAPVSAAFSNELVKCQSFDLFRVDCSHYAFVDNDSVRVEVAASRRPDANCNWVTIDIIDKHLIQLADQENRADVKEKKGAFREW